MRYKCIVMYDGTNFHGFQIQNDLRTVQLEIENVLKVVTKCDTKIYPAGRTDTGVHAFGQVFHFDTDIKMKEWQMKNAINSRLPRDIYIKSVEIVDEASHSRFSAKTKEYHYIIDLNEYDPLLTNYRYFYKHKIDIEKMIDASKIFIGVHDFKAFTKNHKMENTVREIYSIDFEVVNNVIKIIFKGNGFLHNMVRIIVAMLIEVGNGRKTKEDLEKALISKDRKLAPKIAPANALYLVDIKYSK